MRKPCFRLCRTRPPMRPDEPFRPEILSVDKTSIILGIAPRYQGGSAILEFEVQLDAQFPVNWGKQAFAPSIEGDDEISKKLREVRNRKVRFKKDPMEVDMKRLFAANTTGEVFYSTVRIFHFSIVFWLVF